MAKKKTLSRTEKRNMRIQQILFVTLSAIILLAMILSLVSN
jgi:hypothetical protein